MLLVYIPCKNLSEAETLGRVLLQKKLCGCINILPEIASLFFWPEASKTIEKNKKKFFRRPNSYRNIFLKNLHAGAKVYIPH